jgi:peptide/nickel transport system substrate-binding protein
MKSVIYRHVAEPATQRLLLEAGDADLARDLTPDQVAALEGKDNIAIGTYPQAAVHFFSLNQKVAALQNPKVWEAVRYLVDYDGMTKSFLRGQMKIHQAFWPEGFPGALNDTPFTLDVAKAKALLAEAGVKDGLTIKMDVISSPPFTEIAQSLQSTFAQAGITLDLVPGTGSQVITKYRARNHEAVLLYWGPDFMDPHSNAGAFSYNIDNSDGSPQSTTTWRNAWLVPELSAETEAALQERDAAKRDAMYIDLQRKVQQSSPIVIMFQAVAQVAMRSTVHGYVNGATTDQIYYRLVTKQ